MIHSTSLQQICRRWFVGLWLADQRTAAGWGSTKTQRLSFNRNTTPDYFHTWAAFVNGFIIGRSVNSDDVTFSRWALMEHFLLSRLSKKTTRHDIQQKTRQMSRHYWDIYTTYDIEFLRRKKWKKNMKRNFFQNFKFFYIKLPNVICCIQCHDMCCLLDVFCCILMSWHMLRHWTVYWCLFNFLCNIWLLKKKTCYLIGQKWKYCSFKPDFLKRL